MRSVSIEGVALTVNLKNIAFLPLTKAVIIKRQSHDTISDRSATSIAL